MKKLLALLVSAVLLGGTAAPAFAQDEPATQFIDIEAYLVNGEIKVPQAYEYDAKRRAEFDRLGKIDKKSFTPRTVASGGSI